MALIKFRAEAEFISFPWAAPRKGSVLVLRLSGLSLPYEPMAGRLE